MIKSLFQIFQFLTFVSLNLLIVTASFPCLAKSDIYLSGFITDKETKQGIEEAIIVITSNHRRLFSLTSGQNGWFETTTPLSTQYLKKQLKVNVFKRGYNPVNDKPIELTKSFNHYSIKMSSLDDYHHDVIKKEHINNVLYGNISDNNTQKPVDGAIITLTQPESGQPIASAVSRSSGYFNLYYPEIYTGKCFSYTLEHYNHDTEEGFISLSQQEEPGIYSLIQNSYKFSIGPALHFQTTGTQSDKESGGALMLNLSWHRKNLIVVNRFYPRYKKSGILGIDLSFGAIPFRNAKEGFDDFDTIYVTGLGLSYAIKNFLLPIRFGITYSSTDEAALYIGLNIPVYYF